VLFTLKERTAVFIDLFRLKYKVVTSFYITVLCVHTYTQFRHLYVTLFCLCTSKYKVQTSFCDNVLLVQT